MERGSEPTDYEGVFGRAKPAGFPTPYWALA